MKTIDEERNAFEASYRKALLIRDDELKGLFDEIALSGTDYREYAHTQVQIAWEVWQAARHTNNVPVAQGLEELERGLCVIGVVGQIDGHDVVRRESVINIARDRIAKANAEAATVAKADKRDAERYRWLRSDDIEWVDGMPYAAYDKRMLMEMVTIPLTESELDSAIDQCMNNATETE